MINSKRIVSFLITGCMLASLIGCSTTTSNETTENEPIVQEEVSVQTVEATPTPTEEPEAIAPEPEETVFNGILVKPDEEVEVKKGDCLMVEGDDAFVLNVTDVSIVNGSLRVAFDGTEGGVTAEQVYFQLTAEEKQAYNTDKDFEEVTGNYFPHAITITKGGTNVATIKLADRVKGMEPVILSKIPGQVFTTSDYEYVESEMAYIYFDKDVTYPADIEQLIDDTMRSLEKVTGYQYYPEEIYNNSFSVGTPEIYIGKNPWEGVNPLQQKIDIYFFSDKSNNLLCSCASSKEAIFITQDVLSEDGQVVHYDTLAHELTHVLFNGATGENTCKIMNEGEAMYYEILACQELNKKYAVDKNSLIYDYGLLDNLNSETAESLFANDYQDDTSKIGEYRYGFMLFSYLTENYGDETIQDFFDVLNEKHYAKDTYKADIILECLKEVYGDDIFVSFGHWYETAKNNYK